MKVKVTNVGEGWKFNEDADPLYTLAVEGMGEPIKTYDKALAVLGEHEAEEYTAKSGKVYWRIPKARTGYSGPRGPQEKVFKADPAKLSQEMTLETARNMSIQRQVAYKGVVDLVVAGKIELEDWYRYFGYSMELLSATDWQSVVNPKQDEQADVVPDDVDLDDLPPVDVYDLDAAGMNQELTPGDK